MGCFDSVMFKCPLCGGVVDAQSKSGPCAMRAYLPGAVPHEVISGLLGRAHECEKCGKKYSIVTGVSCSLASADEELNYFTGGGEGFEYEELYDILSGRRGETDGR